MCNITNLLVPQINPQNFVTIKVKIFGINSLTDGLSKMNVYHLLQYRLPSLFLRSKLLTISINALVLPLPFDP